MTLDESCELGLDHLVVISPRWHLMRGSSAREVLVMFGDQTFKGWIFLVEHFLPGLCPKRAALTIVES